MTSDENRELKRSLDEHREDTKANFAAVRAEMQAGFAEGHAALDEKVTALDRRVTSVDQKAETLDLKVTALQGDVKLLHVGQGAIIAAVQQLMASE